MKPIFRLMISVYNTITGYGNGSAPITKLLFLSFDPYNIILRLHGVDTDKTVYKEF